MAVKTCNSTTTPYCTAADLFIYHDPNQVADCLRDGEVARPTAEEMADTGNPYGAVLYRFLLAASGRIESACLIKRMYSPTDLQALTGASLQTLQKLTADVCFWMVMQRRQPNTGDPRNVPGAVEANELLDQLRDGERIFSFEETQQAGLPSVVPPNPSALVTPNVITRAVRLFPNYGLNGANGGAGD